MSYSKIIENLYLGNQYSTTIIKRIDTIVSIGCNSKANNITNKITNNITNYKISVRDKKSTDLTPHLDNVTDYINEELNKKHKVLVHCKAGINRSTAFVLAYLCKYEKMSIEDAKKILSIKRPIVKFQEHYMKQIEMWLSNLTNVSDSNDSNDSNNII